MKTSSKLLIILAVALFVIPLVGMVIYAKITRVDGKMYMATMKNEGENVNAEDRFLVSRKVDNFNKIVIEGADNLYTSISIIKSDQPKVKFIKNTEKIFKTSVDATGTLFIKVDSIKDFQYSSIYVFVPALESLSLNKLQVSRFDTNFDHMNIHASQINNSLNFGENEALKTLQLTVDDSKISIGKSHQVDSFLEAIESFAIRINNGRISMAPKQYKTLQVDLHNADFNFIIERDADKTIQASIENLLINSHGVSDVSLPEKAIEIEKLTGSLSDSTTIDLPYYRTKSLFLH